MRAHQPTLDRRFHLRVTGTLVEVPAKTKMGAQSLASPALRHLLLKTIPCKKSAIPLNSCAPSPTSAPAPIPKALSSRPQCLAFATHLFFQERGFLYIQTPIITGSDCEGAGEMFRVTTLDVNPRHTDSTVDFSKDFFDKPAYLTVSGQLEGEIYACALSDIYTFGPTFRAENSNTSRHLAEFWMIEPEMAFADLNADMDCAEELTSNTVFQYVLEHCTEDMEFFDAFIEKGLIERLQHVVDIPFEHLTYTEAVDILEKIEQNLRIPRRMGHRSPIGT